ncbi:response regulator transcription factor [Roseiconus lacunae]|uniref:Response regulator transcription factor n=2 Tax=Roseiconus lacunae TaxID=2605694 RepID=A0ABT7PRZ3_9BACT|nr:response regulator transcription factor [Roseiconus lacunae]MDM4019262.1 response regulator transcription factor [Roseiconus lacunae]
MSLKTLVVDDHEAARVGLTQLMEGTSVSIAKTVEDGESALRCINEEEFDVVLIDVQMKKMDGLSLLEEIRGDHPDLPVVLFSAYDYSVYMARAVANGAQDYVLKTDELEVIERVIQHVSTNRTSCPGGRLDSLRSKLCGSDGAGKAHEDFPLTGRESQVLRHIAFGLSNREIAKSLAISVETVKEHVQNILRKTGASDRTDVAVRAVRKGLV